VLLIRVLQFRPGGERRVVIEILQCAPTFY
jgi:hypothetical protein